jgi:hypothetical protein
MSSVQVDIDRLQITVHGVSSQVVEEATQLLGAELRRRLGGQRFGDLGSFDAGELSLDPIKVTTRLDPSSLSGLMAERLVAGLFNHSKSVLKGDT